MRTKKQKIIHDILHEEERLPPKFRGLENCYIVKVFEGDEGTPAYAPNAYRVVGYVYDTNLNYIGTIDNIGTIDKHLN